MSRVRLTKVSKRDGVGNAIFMLGRRTRINSFVRVHFRSFFYDRCFLVCGARVLFGDTGFGFLLLVGKLLLIGGGGNGVLIISGLGKLCGLCGKLCFL